MKSSILIKIISPFLVFLMPINFIMLTVGMVIFWKMFSDFYVLKNNRTISRKQRCNRRKKIYWNLLVRMLLFQSIIVTFWMIDKNVTYGFGLKIGLLTKAVATILIIITGYEIDQNYKAVNGKGVIDYVRNVAGWVKDLKDVGKDVLKLIIVFLSVFAILSFVACTNIRNAERRHDRIVKNFPNVHQGDTIEVIKEIQIEVPGFKDSNLLVFDSISYVPIYDTIYFQDSIMVVNTIWMSEDGKNNIKTGISVPTKTITKTIKEKQPVIYVNRDLKFYQKYPWLLFLTGFIFGYFLHSMDKKLNKKT